MHKTITRFFLFLALLTLPIAAHAAQIVGLASSVIGDVKIKSANSEEVTPLAQGTEISLGDTLLTSEGGFVTVGFLDNSTLTINGADGELTVDEYIFDPAKLDEGKAKFSVLKGSFEFIGGLLDKGADENVQIRMDFGSIGVRGTKVLRAMRDHECWIYLEEGDIRVFNDGGEVFLKAGDGTRMSDLKKSPLPAKPWSQDNIDWIKGAVSVPK